MAANRNVGLLQEQIRRFEPKYAALASDDGRQREGISRGDHFLVEMVTAPDVDLVVVAIVGAAGLGPTLEALRAGKQVALANKETLVMAGPIIKEQLHQSGGLVPIDSEHSAIWQCLQGESVHAVERVVLTASGGSFRDLSEDQLADVTPEAALAHPTWIMGPKITVDSATLMNKGLEVIEATLLFDIDMDQVDVVMHRESIVHSLVYFSDSSVKAQLGLPDMRLPIQYALGHPDRWANDFPRLDLAQIRALHFEEVNWARFPCLKMAVEAGRKGGTFPAALCAGDETAVELFIAGRISFMDIAPLVEHALERHTSCSNPSLDDILQADATAREACLGLVEASHV